MPRSRFPLFALALCALPMSAAAQQGATTSAAGVTGAQILACETDRTAEGCATLLARLFVCDRAEAMESCAELLALRDAAIEMVAREAAVNGEAVNDAGNGEGADDAVGIVPEPGEATEDLQVEVRAEGELADESEEEAVNDENGTTRDDVAAGNGDACVVLASADWAAWVNAMPGPDAPQLIVTGTVTLPSPGYSVTLEAGITDRSARPVQVVQLSASAPELDAPQVLSDYELRFEMPAPAPIDGTTAPYSGVRVVCGGQEIVLIAPVEVAQ